MEHKPPCALCNDPIPFLLSFHFDRRKIEKKNNSEINDKILQQLTRIAESLERRHPTITTEDAVEVSNVYIWNKESVILSVFSVKTVDISPLKGIDEQRDKLLNNTIGFVRATQQITSFVGRKRTASPRW